MVPILPILRMLCAFGAFHCILWGSRVHCVYPYNYDSGLATAFQEKQFDINPIAHYSMEIHEAVTDERFM